MSVETKNLISGTQSEGVSGSGLETQVGFCGEQLMTLLQSEDFFKAWGIRCNGFLEFETCFDNVLLK